MAVKNRKTILLIDDEEDLVMILKTILEREGYEVLTAGNGEEGLKRLKEKAPHLIILDMNMPRMGGVAFFHEIANYRHGSAAYPVLVVTARANLEHLFREFEVDGFMAKPFSVDAVLHQVRSILEKRFGSSDPLLALGGKEKVKRVLIVEDDKTTFDKMVAAFAEEGYIVNAAHSGASGIERAMQDQPSIILIKLGLPDMAGDLVALRMKQMPGISGIPLLLYTPHHKRLQRTVTGHICEKIGIRELVATDDPAVLLQESKLALSKRQ